MNTDWDLISLVIFIIIILTVSGCVIYLLWIDWSTDRIFLSNCEPLDDSQSMCYYNHVHNPSKVTIKVIPN